MSAIKSLALLSFKILIIASTVSVMICWVILLTAELKDINEAEMVQRRRVMQRDLLLARRNQTDESQILPDRNKHLNDNKKEEGNCDDKKEEDSKAHSQVDYDSFARARVITISNNAMRELIALMMVIGTIRNCFYLCQTSAILSTIIWLATHVIIGEGLWFASRLFLTQHFLYICVIVVSLIYAYILNEKKEDLVDGDSERIDDDLKADLKSKVELGKVEMREEGKKKQTSGNKLNLSTGSKVIRNVRHSMELMDII